MQLAKQILSHAFTNTQTRTNARAQASSVLLLQSSARVPSGLGVCVAPRAGTLAEGFYWGAVLSQAACPMLTKPGIACCQLILCAPSGKNQLG